MAAPTGGQNHLPGGNRGGGGGGGVRPTGRAGGGGGSARGGGRVGIGGINAGASLASESRVGKLSSESSLQQGSISRRPWCNMGSPSQGANGTGSAPGLPRGGNGSAFPHRAPPERKVETQFPCRVIVTNWVQIDSGSDGSFGVLEIAAAIRGKNQIPVVKPKFKFIFILDPLI